MSDDVKVTIPEDEIQNKQRKNFHFFSYIIWNLSEFMNNSSIHGLKYLVGKDRTIFEKILWFTVLFLCVYTCFLWITSTWQKWEENPTFIGFGQNPVHLWQIPFPAVTICPGHGFNKLSNYTFSYSADNKSWEVGNMSKFCDDAIFTEFDVVDTFEGPKWEKFLIETRIPREYYLLSTYRDEYALFSPFITELGVCYSFNMLNKKNLLRNTNYVASTFGNQDNISYWNFDKNYFTANEKVYPQRSKSLEDTLALDLNSELNSLTCGGFNEYFLIIHHPAEIPPTDRAILIHPNVAHNIEIKPEIFVAMDSLKTFSASRKKCYFSDKRYLHFYKIYTEENCKMECLANYTLRRCGCVPYYLPHNKTTKLCAREDTKNRICTYKAKTFILESEFGVSEVRSNLPCNCLRSCNSIIYEPDVQVRDFSPRTTVVIKFKNKKFNVLERQELFGDVNFWASCGGIVGLFTGFSVVSFAEIIYYLCFRLLYNLGTRLTKRLKLNTFMLFTVK